MGQFREKRITDELTDRLTRDRNNGRLPAKADSIQPFSRFGSVKEELVQKVEKERGEKDNLQRQIRNIKEKDIKKLQNEVQIFKEKTEELEGKEEENKRTINSINDYLNYMKRVNKELQDIVKKKTVNEINERERINKVQANDEEVKEEKVRIICR